MPGRINFAWGKVWPSVTLKTLNAVVIRFVAGYTSKNNVPKEVRSAIKLLVGHLYENREETSTDRVLEQIPMGIYALLDLDRMITFRWSDHLFHNRSGERNRENNLNMCFQDVSSKNR